MSTTSYGAESFEERLENGSLVGKGDGWPGLTGQVTLRKLEARAIGLTRLWQGMERLYCFRSLYRGTQAVSQRGSNLI